VPVYLLSVLALVLAPIAWLSLSWAMAALLIVFALGWFQSIRLPLVRLSMPVGLAQFGLFALIVYVTRQSSPLEAWVQAQAAGTHPALLRQGYFVLAVAGVSAAALVLGAAATAWRVGRMRVGALGAALAFPLALVCEVVSAVAYGRSLAGRLGS
jgi:hypothetical protein